MGGGELQGEPRDVDVGYLENVLQCAKSAAEDGEGLRWQGGKGGGVEGLDRGGGGGTGAEQSCVVGGRPVPLGTQVLLPCKVAGTGNVVDLCGAVPAVVRVVGMGDGEAVVES